MRPGGEEFDKLGDSRVAWTAAGRAVVGPTALVRLPAADDSSGSFGGIATATTVGGAWASRYTAMRGGSPAAMGDEVDAELEPGTPGEAGAGPLTRRSGVAARRRAERRAETDGSALWHPGLIVEPAAGPATGPLGPSGSRRDLIRMLGPGGRARRQTGAFQDGWEPRMPKSSAIVSATRAIFHRSDRVGTPESPLISFCYKPTGPPCLHAEARRFAGETSLFSTASSTAVENVQNTGTRVPHTPPFLLKMGKLGFSGTSRP